MCEIRESEALCSASLISGATHGGSAYDNKAKVEPEMCRLKQERIQTTQALGTEHFQHRYMMHDGGTINIMHTRYRDVAQPGS